MEKMGAANLDCLVPIHGEKVSLDDAYGVQATFCLDPKTDALRVNNVFKTEAIQRSRMGTFQGHPVPLDMKIYVASHLMASSHVDALETQQVAEAETLSSIGLERTAVQVSAFNGLVKPGKIILRVPPVYPVVAKKMHVSGIVVFSAKILKTGHIGALDLITSPNDLLTEAAREVVLQWVYEPFRIGDEPVEVNTQITVNFALR